MTENKLTIGEFAAQSDETPDSSRWSLVTDATTVEDEENLPESSQPNVVRHKLLGDGPLVYEYDWAFKRTYVDDFSEVPEGAELHVGDRGGVYFEEGTMEFRDAMFDSTEEVARDDSGDYPEEDIVNAIQNAQEAQEMARETFGMWMDMVQESGAEIHEAGHRVKGLGSALKKVHTREDSADEYDSVDELRDWHGSQVVVGRGDEVHETFDSVVNQLEERDDVDLDDVNNHFENEASDPYRAYNVKAEVDGQIVEFQIKYDGMDDIASVSHAVLLKPEEYEDLYEQVETLPDDPDDFDKDGPLADAVKDCLIQQADVLEGKMDEEDVVCEDRAFETIERVHELK